MANEINFAAIPQTAIKVLTQPVAFFREMPKTGGFVEPLIFALVLGLIGGAISVVVSALKFFTIYVVAAIVIWPIAIVIGSFIGAAVLFIIWQLLGSKQNFEVAFRCAAYMSAIAPVAAVINILQLIPYASILATLLVSAIWLYFVVIASVEVHGIPAQKAWMVFGIIVGILTLMSMCTQFVAYRAASNLERAGKVWSDSLEKSAKEMQKQTELLQKAAEMQQAQQAQQPQQQAPSQDQMKQQMEQMQKQLEQMQKQQANK